jgi:hypothetical protein
MKECSTEKQEVFEVEFHFRTCPPLTLLPRFLLCIKRHRLFIFKYFLMRLARILQVQRKKWFQPLVFIVILVSPKKEKKKEGGHFIF